MKIIAGIDVAKQHLDVCLAQGPPKRFDNTPDGIGGLIQWLRRGAVQQAVCEASGGYERRLVQALRDASVAVSVAHPNRVRAFARASGREAKTDGLDAQTLVEYASTFALPPCPAMEPTSQEIRECVSRRRQLMEQRVQELNRLEQEPSPAVARSCKSHLRWLEREIGRLDERCRKVLGANRELAQLAALYQSVTGVGEGCATLLIAYLPELGHCPPKALTALAGLAPWSRDSGQQHGKRVIRGGRAVVRRGLYMAALSASRHNHDLHRFYKRLRTRGKPAKVALTAVMRKLLLLLHAIAKRGTPWVENYTPAT